MQNIKQNFEIIINLKNVWYLSVNETLAKLNYLFKCGKEE